MSGAGVIAAGIVGYLLGTFPSADLATRFATRGTVDLRTAGSGNPGATNAAQVLGTKWGIAVLVIDVAKGVAAGLAGMVLGGDAGGYLAATMSIAGHIFPVWSRFRGGKGVATSAGACLAVFPAYFPIDLAVAAIGAVAAKRAERATQISGAVWVGASMLWWRSDLPNAWGPNPSGGLFVFAAGSTALILGKFAHARRAIQRKVAT
jgi:acyl phosphate:glycerol-3-phosphate acyltransferase